MRDYWKETTSTNQCYTINQIKPTYEESTDLKWANHSFARYKIEKREHDENKTDWDNERKGFN